MARLSFPEGFLWGAATAAYQVEGGIENTDWAQAARDGKVPPAGNAADHYNRFESDFDMAQELGHTAHRLSVEWARIEPEEGKFDEREIEHYRNVLAALQERGLVPLVTLWHFTLPQWLADMGGTEHPEFPEYFARYCKHVVHALHQPSVRWTTINEPAVFSSNGWLRGIWPPFKKGRLFAYRRVTNNLARAHNDAYERIKRIAPDAEVSIVKDNIYFHTEWGLVTKLIAVVLNWFWDKRILSKVVGHVDAIGLNYYFHKGIGIVRHPMDGKSDFGWDIYPRGIYCELLELKQYGKPVFIAENGLADAKDEKRADFIRDHLYWVHRAIAEGVDVRGYLHWSLLDNYEWAAGYTMRFGLVEVDFETQERTVRPSAQAYKKICTENALKYEE